MQVLLKPFGTFAKEQKILSSNISYNIRNEFLYFGCLFLQQFTNTEIIKMSPIDKDTQGLDFFSCLLIFGKKIFAATQKMSDLNEKIK